VRRLDSPRCTVPRLVLGASVNFLIKLYRQLDEILTPLARFWKNMGLCLRLYSVGVVVVELGGLTCDLTNLAEHSGPSHPSNCDSRVLLTQYFIRFYFILLRPEVFFLRLQTSESRKASRTSCSFRLLAYHACPLIQACKQTNSIVRSA
jgi:hypothetical protein